MKSAGLVPRYDIRGISLYGFDSITSFLDHLYADETLKTGTLVAINAEKVLTAEQNPEVRALIDEAEYNYPDGISIVRSIRKKYPQAQITRIPGVDLWEALMERAGREGTPLFLVGGKPDVLQQTIDNLRQQWQVNLVGSQDGYFATDDRETLFARIADSGAKVVTVAMGSPRQELLIRDCKAYYADALYMGVGGTYDVFTGHVKRAPKLWQSLGLEWLYRLVRQPTRLERQLRLLKYLRYYWRGDL